MMTIMIMTMILYVTFLRVENEAMLEGLLNFNISRFLR